MTPLAKRTALFDPQLAKIRLAARTIPDQKDRHEVESARYHLFDCLDKGDMDGAKEWLRALELATRVIPHWANVYVQEALTAISHHIQGGQP